MALQRMGWTCLNVGIRMRSALVASICKKSFNMAKITKENQADAVSFVASDIHKIFDGVQDLHDVWTSPFMAAAIIVLISTQVGIWVSSYHVQCASGCCIDGLHLLAVQKMPTIIIKHSLICHFLAQDYCVICADPFALMCRCSQVWVCCSWCCP